jgi:hypothetical protein
MSLEEKTPIARGAIRQQLEELTALVNESLIF